MSSFVKKKSGERKVKIFENTLTWVSLALKTKQIWSKTTFQPSPPTADAVHPQVNCQLSICIRPHQTPVPQITSSPTQPKFHPFPLYRPWEIASFFLSFCALHHELTGAPQPTSGSLSPEMSRGHTSTWPCPYFLLSSSVFCFCFGVMPGGAQGSFLHS